MTSPKKPRDTLPPGDTEADALAALFTVRYPMAPDVPPEASREPPQPPAPPAATKALPKGAPSTKKAVGRPKALASPLPPVTTDATAQTNEPVEPTRGPDGLRRWGAPPLPPGWCPSHLGDDEDEEAPPVPAGPRAPIRRLTTEEVIELLKAQAPPPSRGSDMASEVPEDEPADEGDGDEETDDDCGDEEVGEEYEGNIEWDITNRIIEDALNLGYSVSVFGEEGWPLALGRLERSTNTREINAALGETEREFLRFTDDDGTIVGWVLLAWGAGRDMIGDYSENDATVAVLRMAWALSEAMD